MKATGKPEQTILEGIIRHNNLMGPCLEGAMAGEAGVEVGVAGGGAGLRHLDAAFRFLDQEAAHPLLVRPPVPDTSAWSEKKLRFEICGPTRVFNQSLHCSHTVVIGHRF